MTNNAIRLVALAAAMAGATTAFAQSSVTIYGRLDVAAERLSISGSGPSRSASLLSNDGSRFGLRASEDLGGGSSAIFNIEQGFAPDTGAATQGGLAWGRTAWVGLADARFGELRLGRNYIPMDDEDWQFDPFAAAGLGAHWTLQPYAGRVNNSVKYLSPKVGAFTAEAMVAASEGVAGGKQVGLAGLYLTGALDGKLAYTKVKNAVPAGDRQEWLLAASYRFGAPRLSVMHYIRKDDGAAARLTSTVYGGNYTIGNGDVRLSYTNLKQGAESTRRFALGYWQNLSKRTSLYTAYARQTNSAGRNTTLNPSFIALNNGEDVSGFEIGMRHNF